MGYRMYSVNDKNVCHGKLFGYADEKDWKKFKSYKYLLKSGYITGKEKFDYDGEHFFIMCPENFRTFIDLYNQDYCKLWELKPKKFLSLSQWFQYHNNKWKIIYWI